MEGGPNMYFEILDSGGFIRGERINFDWKKNNTFYEGNSKKVPMYITTLKITKPGVYKIYVDPKPYFEPSQKKYIKQITKVIIQAMGLEEGWDEPAGLKAEIVSLVKPFAIWEGNTFRGQVLIDGKPAKNIEVEVEYLNTNGVKFLTKPSFLRLLKQMKMDILNILFHGLDGGVFLLSEMEERLKVKMVRNILLNLMQLFG